MDFKTDKELLTQRKATVNFVRNNFFPRWDKDYKWRVIYKNSPCGKKGNCDSDKKVIYIAPWLRGNELIDTLIHEICHAVTNSGHGKLFLQRLSKAEEKAKAMGLNDLAIFIHKDIVMTGMSSKVTADLVHSCIKGVVMDLPDITFKQLIKTVSCNVGMSSKIFLNKYKQSKKIFLKEKRFWKKLNKLRKGNQS